MKKDLTDNELDRLMQSIICDPATDDDLREIADSPTVWWAVQREIANGSEARSPWPPSNAVRRWLMILAPTAVLAAIAISLFVWWPAKQQISAPTVASNEITAPQSSDSIPTSTVLQQDTKTADSARPTFARSTETRRAMHQQRIVSSTQTAKNTPSKSPEIKTDFIALTYARNPQSGQIVRVKVPRSMMAQLGLVASVSKPNDLVDAEVVVGDDGLTRAIRFIH